MTTTRQIAQRKRQNRVDAASIIKAVCDDLNANGFCHSPKIIKRSDFDRTGFKMQESDIPGVRFEFVNQRGPGIAGDDYNGILAVQIGDGLMFIASYST